MKAKEPIPYRLPTPHNAIAVRKSYKAIAKFSMDTGNPLEQIGPEGVTHLVAFWEYLAPMFRVVFIEGIEQELRKNPEFCALTEDQQQDVLRKKWNDYVRKSQILTQPHAWVLDKNEEA